MPSTAIVGAAIVLLTRCVEPDEGLGAIDGRLLLLIVSMLVLGTAMPHLLAGLGWSGGGLIGQSGGGSARESGDWRLTLWIASLLALLAGVGRAVEFALHLLVRPLADRGQKTVRVGGVNGDGTAVARADTIGAVPPGAAAIIGDEHSIGGVGVDSFRRLQAGHDLVNVAMDRSINRFPRGAAISHDARKW